MFARVLRCHFKVGNVERAARLFEKSVLPQCRKQPGFKGAYFLTDFRTRESVFITLWTSEKAMLASEKNLFFQQQVAKFIPFYESSPVRESYEVILKAQGRERRPSSASPAGDSGARKP